MNRSLDKKWILKKLFSAFGVFPIGTFVIIHLYRQLSSLQGPEIYNATLNASRTWPLIVPMAILGLWIPIVYHGLYGLWIAKTGKPNLKRYQYFQNLKYILQRLSGFGLLFFIPAHIFKTRIEPTLEAETLDFFHLSHAFHEPLTLSIYALGILGVSFHLANGFWQFCLGWGIVTSEQGMRKLEKGSVVLFLLVLGMGYGAIWGFLKY